VEDFDDGKGISDSEDRTTSSDDGSSKDGAIESSTSDFLVTLVKVQLHP
jgi:hypothetical protein